ncbi:MAG: YfiR family protein [Sporocytophaga sp.]|uniref:YfiR family protein n=1 Tax=Sporocytophaga sp. TaxID=2231183 RepID=UPI001B15D1CE|nr:YfiR family protein [Sporocytophaga sp.]MBO9698900.1 YfiR family protein [Sporocytophaga sp.]
MINDQSSHSCEMPADEKGTSRFLMIQLVLVVFCCSGFIIDVHHERLMKSCSEVYDIVQEGEYSLKAAFIYRFTEYVDWEGMPKEEEFKIAILGDTPLTRNLINIAENAEVGNRKINVEEYDNLNEIDECQILFVSRESSVPLQAILHKFEGKETLIVTEKEGYGEKGSCINFFLSESKIKFEVNLEAVEKAGLAVSSQLLQHAVVIGKQR